MIRTPLAGVAAVVVMVVVGGCAVGDPPDVDGARAFDRHPIYWLGESFEGHELEHMGGLEEWATAVVLIYGTCDIEGYDGGCAPPLQVQIFPLFNQLEAVARNRRWRTRTVRGAPVGSIDGVPVLFTSRVQVKVYRGQDSSPGMSLRALAALRSLNAVEPVIAAGEAFPGPPEGVLAGERPCSG